jgi:hypothetical protein
MSQSPLETHPHPNVRSGACRSEWTPERVSRAARLYITEGLTAAEVADSLGPSFSRCAVIGKLRRLGFLKREARAPGAGGAVRTRVLHTPPSSRSRVEQRLPPRRPPVPLPPLREPGPTGAPAPLACLPEGACRWPIDDPGPGQMHRALFCAGPADGHVYCATHRALACDRTLEHAA